MNNCHKEFNKLMKALHKEDWSKLKVRRIKWGGTPKRWKKSKTKQTRLKNNLRKIGLKVSNQSSKRPMWKITKAQRRRKLLSPIPSESMEMDSEDREYWKIEESGEKPLKTNLDTIELERQANTNEQYKKESVSSSEASDNAEEFEDWDPTSSMNSVDAKEPRPKRKTQSSSCKRKKEAPSDDDDDEAEDADDCEDDEDKDKSSDYKKATTSNTNFNLMTSLMKVVSDLLKMLGDQYNVHSGASGTSASSTTCSDASERSASSTKSSNTKRSKCSTSSFKSTSNSLARNRSDRKQRKAIKMALNNNRGDLSNSNVNPRSSLPSSCKPTETKTNRKHSKS